MESIPKREEIVDGDQLVTHDYLSSTRMKAETKDLVNAHNQILSLSNHQRVKRPPMQDV